MPSFFFRRKIFDMNSSGSCEEPTITPLSSSFATSSRTRAASLPLNFGKVRVYKLVFH